jgi:hypothetical protein
MGDPIRLDEQQSSQNLALRLATGLASRVTGQVGPSTSLLRLAR